MLSPVNIKPSYMGAPPATQNSHNLNYRLDHFYRYKHKKLCRTPPFHYEFGGMKYRYTPSPDASVYRKRDQYYCIPPTKVSTVDKGRLKEIDDFFTVCQLHRDAYRDDTGTLHPMKYFAKTEYCYQCPRDPTTQYFTYPEYYVKYKQPYVLPQTLRRTLKTPILPKRALTGVFDPISTVVWPS